MKKTLWITTLIAIILDQIVKIIITTKLELNQSIEVLNNLFYITSTRNTGGAWGILGNYTFILVICALVFILFFINYIIKEKPITIGKNITYGMLLGGIIGNLIDRIMHGYVIDYFHIYIFSYDFPVFNISDMLILTSVIILVIEIIRGEINENKSK